MLIYAIFLESSIIRILCIKVSNKYLDWFSCYNERHKKRDIGKIQEKCNNVVVNGNFFALEILV